MDLAMDLQSRDHVDKLWKWHGSCLDIMVLNDLFLTQNVSMGETSQISINCNHSQVTLGLVYSYKQHYTDVVELICWPLQYDNSESSTVDYRPVSK